MRKALATVGLPAALVIAVWAGGAQATPLSVTVTADGGAPITFTGNDILAVNGQSFGVFNVNTINVFSAPVGLTLPSILNSNAIDADTTTADGVSHTLAIDVVGSFSGITPGTYSLTSSFDTTGLAIGWNVKEITDINGVNLPPGFNFTATQGTQAGALDQTDTVTVGASFTGSEHFLITTNGSEGAANTGIEMATSPVGAPGPTLGASLPGVAFVAFLGFIMWRRGGLQFSLMP